MILPFHKIGRSDANKAGGKGASLGEMTQAGIPVPPGFVVLAEAFEAFIDANNVRSEIHDILEHLDHNSVTSIESSSARIQELILAGDIPENIQREIQTYQKDITTDYVAVRSSATAEDGIEHAWAGQLDTYLNVPKNAIEKKIQSCWASLFTPRALFYRSEKGLVDIHISVAVIVQSMVDAESAGVAFSVHPVTENTDEIVIEGSWGLGEAVVSGEVTPDSFVISKSSREILSQHIAEKKKGIFRNKNGQNEWREIPEQERENPVLNKKALNQLSELVIQIENHYGFPCDIEWTHAKGKIYILQARPITTLKGKINSIKKDWVNIWSGSWSFLSCTDFASALSHEVKILGEAPFNNVRIFINNGKSACWVPQDQKDILGKKVADFYGNKKEMEKICQLFRESVDDFLRFFEKIKHKKIENKNYKKMWDLIVSEYRLHIIIKYIVDYLEPKLLNKFLPMLAEARVYAEPVFEKSEELMNNWIGEVAQKSKIESRYISCCTREEFQSAIKNNKYPDVGILAQRYVQSVIENDGKSQKIHTGNEAENIHSELTAVAEDGSIHGSCAYPGKVQGIVRIIHDPTADNIFHQGDILVTGMTRPEYIHLAKKSAGIITDAGGILSHAAITAREFKIPCIIGTKNATRVLQDDDLVEVDADNGVIKILEKEESLLENKDLEVWIERKQSIFSMSVFHELESKIMREHLGGGFKTQICFMKDKVCSYIHEIGDFEHVIHNIAQKLQKKSEKDQENYIKEMNRWENIGNKIIKDGSNPVLLSESAMREYLENYKNIGYWTTVVPYFLLEAIHTLGEEKYKKLQEICERLRSNSLYPILNEKITLKVLEYVSLKMGLSHEDAYYITWQETIRGLDGAKPKNKKSIGERKHNNNAFYRNQSGEVLFLDNEEEKEKLRQISYPKEANKLITGKTSYPGKVIGKVRILRTREDMQHFETGDVLISPNSNPSLIGCIKKCSAMVTDEGGVSCHAAVISRELKIPCIIGTKVATKVLQDGDLVEVDADNGTVKKIAQYINGSSITKETKLFSMRDRKQLLSPVYWNGIVQSSPITKDMYGEVLSEIFMVFKDGRQKMFFIQDEWRKISDKISEKIINDKSFFRELVKQEKECREKIQKFIKKEKRENSQKYREKIQSLFIEYDAITVYAWFLASDSLKQKISKYLRLTEEESNYVFLPDEPTYVAQMEKELLENALKKNPDTKKLTEKYYWIPFGYNGPEVWTTDYFKREMNKMNKTEIKRKLENIREGEKRVRDIKEEIHKKYGFSQSQREMIEKMKIITTWTDVRKMLDYQLFYRYYESLKLLSKEKNIKVHILQELFTEELDNLNTQTIEYAKKRIQGQYTLHYKGGKVHILSQKDNEKIIEITQPEIQQEIQGQVACAGGVKKIQGHVQVCKSAKQASTIKTGDILVSSMTTPDYAIGMNRAAGFITDEGGVTCHAAIVAREINKPCIIGTKNATQMLKNHDFVEMNLEDGTIKILEKENEIQWAFTYDRQMSYQRIELFHHGYCTRLSNFFDVNITNELYRIQNGIVSVFYDEVSHKQAFEKIRALLGGEKKAQWYKKIHNTINRDYRDFIDFLNEGEKKKDIKNLEKSLSDHMEHNRKIGLSTWLLYSYVEEILSDEVKRMLAKKGIKNQQEIFQILSQPDEMIPNDTWEYDIAEAALAESKKQEKIIKKLCLKYRSYGMYDVIFDGKNETDIQEKITSIKKFEAQKIIKNLDEKYSKQKSELKKIEKIKWSETESSLIQLYRLYANFKDWKNFHRERSSYQIRDIYKAIAKKYKQKQEYLSYMTEAEILKGIKQKKWPSDQEIKKRKKNSAIIFLDKITKNIIEIEKLQELDKKLFIEKNSLSGTTAFPGNITGTARIINSHDDLKKLEKGDIMVSSTTRPDYLPFMSDIEGFVTNEGGVLSHAAILAREIKKPCIIGTKIATQVIKSGDKITLDGKNGIITIHQKKKNYLENKKLLSEGGRACYLYPNRIFCTRMNIPHPLWENHLMVISTSENHKVNWYFAVDDESEFDYTLRRVLEHKNMLQKGEKEINRLVRKAQKTLKKEYKTAKEAWSGYENFINIYEEIAIVPTFVRQLDRAVVRSLRESIHEEEDFAVAVYPAKRTYQRQEEIALLELRTQFDDKITTDIQKKLSKIYTQYFTSGLGYFEEQIKTKSDYREKLVGNSRKEAKDHLKKIIEEEKEIMQKKQKLKRILPEKAQIIDIAGFLVYLKDHYKFQINRVQHYAEGLFRSISALSGYDESLIRDMTPDEVKNLLLFKKIDKKNIQKRIAYHAYVYNDSGEPELIIGEEAKAFAQKYLATNNLQKSFSGRVACKGQGRGKAKVILGTRDFHKMQQGDILVVMNTSPDFVPIMKKAAAIVAEEGGITGHVSVVSREFGIPSVVGIKQITSIIQDGETIEVDALKGVVTRID